MFRSIRLLSFIPTEVRVGGLRVFVLVERRIGWWNYNRWERGGIQGTNRSLTYSGEGGIAQLSAVQSEIPYLSVPKSAALHRHEAVARAASGKIRTCSLLQSTQYLCNWLNITLVSAMAGSPDLSDSDLTLPLPPFEYIPIRGSRHC
jgi:hypothetical protein